MIFDFCCCGLFDFGEIGIWFARLVAILSLVLQWIFSCWMSRGEVGD